MKWINAEVKLLIVMWEGGQPLATIAKHFHTTEEAISNRISHLMEMGVRISKGKRHQAKWREKEMEGDDYE